MTLQYLTVSCIPAIGHDHVQDLIKVEKDIGMACQNKIGMILHPKMQLKGSM